MSTKNSNLSSSKPITQDSLTSKEFNYIMAKGLFEAKTDKSHLVSDVFSELKISILNLSKT